MAGILACHSLGCLLPVQRCCFSTIRKTLKHVKTHRKECWHHPLLPLNSNELAPILQESRTTIQSLKKLHAYIIICGLAHEPSLTCRLLCRYAMLGSMENASMVFDTMPCKPSAFCWNMMIRGFANVGKYEEVLGVYQKLLLSGMPSDNFTFPFVLKACGGLSAVEKGKEIHVQLLKAGFDSDDHVGNSLVNMYGKCGVMEDARQVFDKMPERTLTTWNALIAGYAQAGCIKEALMLFHQMQVMGMKPDLITITSVLPAFADIGELCRGKSVHCYVIRNGIGSDVIVETALIDMYAKCGYIEVSWALFDRMVEKDVVAWNAMIVGYAQSEHANQALRLFSQMLVSDAKPNSSTILGVLPACAHFAALQLGKSVHDYIIRRGFEMDVALGTALMDMYAKCGNLAIAQRLFDRMCKRNVIAWNVMISGYGLHGHGEDALKVYYQLQQTGLKPDYVTFVGVLSACSHAGLVDRGQHYFDEMIKVYCIVPGVEHYACMVDLLGRAGHLDEAQDFIERMPVKPVAGVWGALLGACRVHGNIELGKQVAERLFHLEPGNAGRYVIMSNIYAAAGKWDHVANVRKLMKHRRVRKPPGCSLIEVGNRIHAFTVGDKRHPQSEEIYKTLAILAERMKEAGYVPDMNSVLHDVEDEVKQHMLFTHSEKLAIAFGIISTSPGAPIRITKNLRVCGDCHNATKFISKIVNREIIMRDTNRFHHFKNGFCSCGDYW